MGKESRRGGEMPEWFGTSEKMPVTEFSDVTETDEYFKDLLNKYRRGTTMFLCENNTLTEVEKEQCKCLLKCTYKTNEGKKYVMDRLHEIYKNDDQRNYGKYKACVLTQMRQLDALDARKQKMTKEGAFYRSYALLKYAILNKAARLNSTSDTLQKFIGGCMNTQKLQKPHKTEKACDKAGNCEWVNTIPQIEEKIDEAFPDDKEKAECEKERVRSFKTYKKFGISPITSDELQEHLTSARVLWLKKHLSKTKARGAPRQQCPHCNGTGTQRDGKECPPITCIDGTDVPCGQVQWIDGEPVKGWWPAGTPWSKENFQGLWPDTNDAKYNIGYEPKTEELQELALKLSTTCAEKSCQSLLKCSKPKNEKEYRSLAANILKHHEEDHRHVMNEAGRPRGDSNASDSSNTQGSTSTTTSNGSSSKSWAQIVKDAEVSSARSLDRRRLAHGVRTPPVLAALMEEIEEAERKYQL